MKNKKLVATVASLCLVVVAVVAAVVGVFAAVQQYAGASVSVSYTANNVSATVILKSLGPVADTDNSVTTRELQISAANSTHYAPTDNSKYNEAFSQTYSYGWSDDAGKTTDVKNSQVTGEFFGYSLLELMFTNTSAVGDAKPYLDVNITISSTLNNVTVKYYKFVNSTSATTGIADSVSGFKSAITASWDEDGDLNNTFALSAASGLSEITPATNSNLLSLQVGAGATTFVYVLMGLTDAATDATSGTLSLDVVMNANATQAQA